MATASELPPYEPRELRRKYLEERDKRLRAENARQYLEAAGQLAAFGADPGADLAPARAPVARDMDVLVIGGGFGGLLTAAALRDRDIGSMMIVERGGDFGGTWYWNRYPGVRCDIESYIYMPLLEEVGTIPKERYAQGSEIFAHCQAIGRHYGLYDRTLFDTRVSRVAWDDDVQRWIVTTDRGDVLRARFVTVSQGPLAKVKLPRIPGIERFRGRMFHSSRWDYAYTGGDSNGGLTKLADKAVAVIGTGATAVQIVPKLAEHAGRLYVVQRTPSAVDERHNAPTDMGWFERLPKGWQKDRMTNFLAIVTGVPQAEDLVGDRWTDIWRRFGGLMAEKLRTGVDTHPAELMQRVDYAKMDELRRLVSQVVRDPATAEALKPWYNYLCKRPLYSDDFLQSFNRSNVTLVDTDGAGVERITEGGFRACGRDYDVDCIVFATGFDVGAPPHKAGEYELVGRGGLSIDDKWKDGVRSLHGTQMSGFPNLHIVGGTAQGTTAFNFTHTLQMQAGHAADLIERCLRSGAASVEVTEAAEARWLAQLEAKHVDHDQFYEDCTPGFLNNEGDFRDRPTFIGGTYGGGPLQYEAVLADWRASRVEIDTVASGPRTARDVG